MSKHIGTLLTNIHIIPQKHQWKMKLFAAWDDIIGHLKNKVRIEAVQDNSITLGVCHPAWAQELHMLAPILKKKFNNALQEDRIKKIHFRTVCFSQRPCSMANKKIHKQQVSKEHCFNILEHTQLESVKNKDLKQALEIFYIRCKKIGTK